MSTTCWCGGARDVAATDQPGCARADSTLGGDRLRAGGRPADQVNHLGDELAQMATAHKAAAVAFFKQVVRSARPCCMAVPAERMLERFAIAHRLAGPVQIATIVRAPNKAFSASEIDLLNALDKKAHPMPVAAAEALLDDFIMNGWVAREYAVP
mgnify:CR=1 FL=1